jgi:two-component system OmpR family sensor kinase/two-component system sensor histidine kinase BaeS
MRIKLLLSFALVVLVSVILVAWIARQGAVNEVRIYMFRGGMSGNEGLAGQLEDYYAQQDSWEGVEALLQTTGHGQGMGQGQGQGQGAGMNEAAGASSQQLLVTDADGKIVADSTTSSPSGKISQSQMDAAVPLNVKGETVGYLLGEGISSVTKIDEKLVDRLNRAAMIAGLIAGAIALFLAFFLAYRLLRPVHDLTLAARHMAQGDLSQRVEVHGEDEIAQLGRAFNQMADALQQSGETRRAMTADIAHELRTPLAVQRANLEALQDGVYDLSPDNLQPVLEQNLLLSRLVDDLRTLALADAGQLPLERIPVDFAGLVGRVVERFQPQAAAHQVSLNYLPSASHLPEISLDAIRIEQILNNLISNALRYTPPGGQVDLVLVREGKLALLRVQDSGPGIPTEALPHVFERFYRADRSRSRAEGGSGLGLAIARQLARAHGGEISAANAPSGSAVFTLTLPLV